MKAIVIADIFIVIIFALITIDRPSLQFVFESEIAVARHTAAQPDGASNIPVTVGGETLYFSAPVAKDVLDTFYDACAIERSCTFSISISDEGVVEIAR